MEVVARQIMMVAFTSTVAAFAWATQQLISIQWLLENNRWHVTIPNSRNCHHRLRSCCGCCCFRWGCGCYSDWLRCSDRHVSICWWTFRLFNINVLALLWVGADFAACFVVRSFCALDNSCWIVDRFRLLLVADKLVGCSHPCILELASFESE